jgi:hypothetical protein
MYSYTNTMGYYYVKFYSFIMESGCGVDVPGINVRDIHDYLDII